MVEPSDEELWARATEGDEQSFGLLYRRHAHTLYNFCFRRTADWAFAEDLTSIVFLEAWRQRGRVQVDARGLLPWLYGVATNLLRRRVRQRLRRDAAFARVLPTEKADDFSEDVAARLDDEQRMREILGLMERLPLVDQEVLVLFAWQGLTYEETAVALGIPVGTVRSRLSRARYRLRELTTSSGHEQGDDPSGHTAEPKGGST